MSQTTSILMAVFRVNLVAGFLRLFMKRSLGDKWHEFYRRDALPLT